MKPLLPHDVLVLTELNLATHTIQFAARAGEFDCPDAPDSMPGDGVEWVVDRVIPGRQYKHLPVPPFPLDAF